jgi:hypothetical protein
MQFAHDFQTVLGRNLVGELKNLVHRPFLVVTMENMWPKFQRDFEGAQYFPYFVKSVDEKVLQADLTKLPTIEAASCQPTGRQRPGARPDHPISRLAIAFFRA